MERIRNVLFGALPLPQTLGPDWSTNRIAFVLGTDSGLQLPTNPRRQRHPVGLGLRLPRLNRSDRMRRRHLFGCHDRPLVLRMTRRPLPASCCRFMFGTGPPAFSKAQVRQCVFWNSTNALFCAGVSSFDRSGSLSIGSPHEWQVDLFRRIIAPPGRSLSRSEDLEGY